MSIWMRTPGRRAAIVIGWFGLLAILAGCHSTSSNLRADVDAMAWVEIHGHGPVAVARVVSDTFKEAGFMVVPAGSDKGMRLQFERPGSSTESVLYGDWSGKVWIRAKIRIETPDPDVQLVKCDVYRVVGHGDPRFEEETRLHRKGQYQELLNRAKARLSN